MRTSVGRGLLLFMLKEEQRARRAERRDANAERDLGAVVIKFEVVVARLLRLRAMLAVGAAQPLPCAAVASLLACRAGDEMACRSEPVARDSVDVLREVEREQ